MQVPHLSQIATRPKSYVNCSSLYLIVRGQLRAKSGFLIILLSTTIYTPAHALQTTINLPLEHLTHSLERRLVLSLLCSFLNTSLTPSNSTTGIGSQLPYNHLISKAVDDRRTLVRASFTMLLVALDYRREDLTQMGEGKDENAFRYFISKLVCNFYLVLLSGLSSCVDSTERRTFRSSQVEFWGSQKNMLQSIPIICLEAKGLYLTSQRIVRHDNYRRVEFFTDTCQLCCSGVWST